MINDLMKNLKKAIVPEEEEEAKDEVLAEDSPQRVKFKKKFIRKSKTDANDAARAALRGPMPKGAK